MALIRGTPGNDRLNGTPYWDDIFGFAGNDTIRAGGGADYVEGAEGNDILYGDAGNDTLVGGSGIDTFFGGTGFDAASFVFDPTGAGGGVTLDLGRTFAGAGGERYAVATVSTPSGTYQEQLTSIEDVLGSRGNDAITGSAGTNFLFGDAGNDTLSGAGGGDTVVGGAGNDRLDGGTGVNQIVTGSGRDTVVFRGDGRSEDLVDFNVDLDTLLIAGTGSRPGITFTQLVNNGTIDVFYDGVDTLIEYGGSDILLYDVPPGWLDNGNVLIG